jgi:proteasome-associated ATPase
VTNVPSTDRSGNDAPRRATELTQQVNALQEEVDVLRRRLSESPRHTRALEERMTDLQSNLAAVTT